MCVGTIVCCYLVVCVLIMIDCCCVICVGHVDDTEYVACVDVVGCISVWYYDDGLQLHNTDGMIVCGCYVIDGG